MGKAHEFLFIAEFSLAAFEDMLNQGKVDRAAAQRSMQRMLALHISNVLCFVLQEDTQQKACTHAYFVITEC